MSHLAIPIIECHEPLIDIRQEGGLLWGPPPERPETEGEYCWVRRGVYERMLRAQASLPEGWRIRLYEGLRSLSMQVLLFDEEKARISAAHPEYDDQAVHDQATVLVAPPVHWDGTPNIPPHSTGAAVDVDIVDAQGTPIDFGMQLHEWTAVDAQYCETRHAGLRPQALQNRLLLCTAMEQVGFVNYAREWWHYSFGDRYWAFLRGEPHAIYGPVGRSG